MFPLNMAIAKSCRPDKYRTPGSLAFRWHTAANSGAGLAPWPAKGRVTF